MSDSDSKMFLNVLDLFLVVHVHLSTLIKASIWNLHLMHLSIINEPLEMCVEEIIVYFLPESPA